MKELIEIQRRLRAPKSKRNTFGAYNYRSCEDILEAVKPILFDLNVTMYITDELICAGQRFYIKAVVTIINSDGEAISVTGLANDPGEKKGMDASQVTGAASSYARKYALNALFLIDDTKDADTDEFARQTKQGKSPDPKALQEMNAAKTKKEVVDVYNKWRHIDAQLYGNKNSALYKAAVKKNNTLTI